MSTAKTGLNWSRTVERYVHIIVMSTAREKAPFGASLLFGLSPLQFSESKKKHGVEQVHSADGRRNGAFAQ